MQNSPINTYILPHRSATHPLSLRLATPASLTPAWSVLHSVLWSSTIIAKREGGTTNEVKEEQNIHLSFICSSIWRLLSFVK
jgi:hypothetical protein